MLAGVPIKAVYTSPLERAFETAEPLARSRGIDPQVVEDLGELRVGEWEGKSFAELEGGSEWLAYNRARSSVRPPGGELTIECQTRMVRTVECLVRAHSEECIAIVSHADPIRLLLCHFLGVPMDLLLRLEIGPASVSAVEVASWGPRVLCMNRMEELPG